MPRTKATDVLVELNRLVKADSAKHAGQEAKNVGQALGPISGATPVVMSPYIVREDKDFEPIVLAPEAPVVRILKKGVLFDPGGRAHSPLVQMRFYTLQTDGVGLGGKGPRNGVELSATWAW